MLGVKDTFKKMAYAQMVEKKDIVSLVLRPIGSLMALQNGIQRPKNDIMH
jgi:hypothetical protein